MVFPDGGGQGNVPPQDTSTVQVLKAQELGHVTLVVTVVDTVIPFTVVVAITSAIPIVTCVAVNVAENVPLVTDANIGLTVTEPIPGVNDAVKETVPDETGCPEHVTVPLMLKVQPLTPFEIVI
ncbi:hypothetical protein [Peribacillus sp. AS_2]|uniref:hypothetical protein n=1 Tax=Peribacillus sp. AS_2 TaxID=2996755 RepID=UPI0022A7E782|nr:hypothetical protein [Peribacillus sp. AS_2]MCZ0874899.1 hypothetical protein [Peribacillus sp. AS_2]